MVEIREGFGAIKGEDRMLENAFITEENIAEDKGEEGTVEKRCLRICDLTEEQNGLVCGQMPAAEGLRGSLGLTAKKSEPKDCQESRSL